VQTVSWYALKLGPSKFGIFDTFADQSGRDAHLTGEIAKALFARAEELFAKPPQIEMPEILAAKGARPAALQTSLGQSHVGVSFEAR
jgi:quinol monooxygenase YgiN